MYILNILKNKRTSFRHLTHIIHYFGDNHRKGGNGTMMKKLLLMLLMSFSFFMVTGCGSDELEEGEKIEEIEEEDEIGDGEIDDE